ncbi:MAG: polysaccharide biosynthesis/export family protein [Phycisphaerales bacterium]|nr:polysaccharide biosynthesis/export family protein [Phycisphaerales bacterium]
MAMTLLIAMAHLVAGCQTSHRDMVSFLKAHEHEVSAIEYRVGIPDVVQISAPRVLEIDQVSQSIRPDGKIALRLLGPVKVVGMTEKEIAAKLSRLLEPYYEDPKVQVRVTGYFSKKIYLSGLVGSGGGYGNGGQSVGTTEQWRSIPYTGRDTVLDILAKTNLSFLAWESQIKVIRSSPYEEERREIHIDVAHMIRTGDTSRNVLLQPNDILVVPPTPLGWLGLRVQEVMFTFNPLLAGYQYPASVKDANDVYNGTNN